mmetsp:Transcript_12319/g.34881  ORF Transcript_12319/g.34881 Transcript_12319/m.34881 type:complete len:271 (+) Transcript_12319:604-1416(+)
MAPATALKRAPRTSRSTSGVETSASRTAWKVHAGYHRHRGPLSDENACGVCSAAARRRGAQPSAKSARPRCAQQGSWSPAPPPALPVLSALASPRLMMPEGPPLFDTSTWQLLISTLARRASDSPIGITCGITSRQHPCRSSRQTYAARHNGESSRSPPPSPVGSPTSMSSTSDTRGFEDDAAALRATAHKANKAGSALSARRNRTILFSSRSRFEFGSLELASPLPAIVDATGEGAAGSMYRAVVFGASGVAAGSDLCSALKRNAVTIA